MPKMKKGLFIVIRDVLHQEERLRVKGQNASQISITFIAGMRLREECEVVIFFLESEMEHVTCLQDYALVITAEVD